MTGYNSQPLVPEHVEQRFTKWQRSLVETKRSAKPADDLIARQQDFVRAATTSEKLVDYLTKHLGIEQELLKAAPHIEGVTEKEMLHRPPEWERHIGKQLSHIEPHTARSSPWWYICHIAWLQRETFPNPPDATFKARVRKSLLSDNPAKFSTAQSKTLDDATRNLLRWLGGLPHIRRLYRVAEDPPIARAWWRYHIAEIAAESVAADTQLTAEDIHRILHKSQWGRFIERSQRTFSSLLAPRALTAACVVSESSKEALKHDHLQAVARRCLQSHPELMDWDELTRPLKHSSKRSTRKKKRSQNRATNQTK